MKISTRKKTSERPTSQPGCRWHGMFFQAEGYGFCCRHSSLLWHYSHIHNIAACMQKPFLRACRGDVQLVGGAPRCTGVAASVSHEDDGEIVANWPCGILLEYSCKGVEMEVTMQKTGALCRHIRTLRLFLLINPPLKQLRI